MPCGKRKRKKRSNSFGMTKNDMGTIVGGVVAIHLIDTIKK